MKSSSRRKARADALQILFQLDMNQGLTTQGALEHFRKFFTQTTPPDEFCERLVIGVSNELAVIDKTLDSFSENWRTDRMNAVDRNVLRLGVFELNFCDDIPTTVSINEMIELAKQFGSESSPSFVNGILDKIRLSTNRPNKAP